MDKNDKETLLRQLKEQTRRWRETARADIMYMRRCLQLAENGMQNARPNPMVGAVITARGRIIGEGYHARCGEGHAEVNAFASVKPEDEALLPEATIYVSLEPCAHYGKTPPCADLIVRKGVRRCVVGCVDPFAKVHGLGIRKLRDAGIQVDIMDGNPIYGTIGDDCRRLNKRFMTFNTCLRPYIMLKWCETADGRIDDNGRPAPFSTPFTQMLVHKLRSEYDAILVGATTAERDKPRLDVRHWYGRSPRRIILSRRNPELRHIDFTKEDTVARQIADWLYGEGVQSLIVEGGSKTLQSFLDEGMFDEVRIETAATTTGGGTMAPQPRPGQLTLMSRRQYDGNTVSLYRKSQSEFSEPSENSEDSENP